MTAPSDFEPESERVTRQLREQILDGMRRPGDRLVERDLADELGVSRVPIRDALHTLAAEGMVTARPRSWSVVREFTASDVADLNEVRAALEPLTFRLAAQRHTREGLQRLRAVLDAEIAAAHAGDAVRAHRAAADFHETVSALAANELLIQMQRPVRSRLRWLLGNHDDLMGVARQHADLYEAIADRDVAAVEHLIADHQDAKVGAAAGRARRQAPQFGIP